MKLGVFIMLKQEIEEEFSKLQKLGFSTCQLSCWNLPLMESEGFAERVKNAAEKYGITITACWCGWSGLACWNFFEGPHTLGLVPMQYREMRVNELKREFDFAKKLGVTDVITHVGYLPEVAASTEYHQMVTTLKDVAGYAKNNGQYFLFETGQETPITLKRTIQDIGLDNLGINLDPANLILYGKANPVDALDVFGEYVRGIHGKDGLYPTDGYELGKEVRIGDGKVNYPAFIKRLKEVGYDGAITIEREISGEEQIKDIIHAKQYFERILEAI